MGQKGWQSVGVSLSGRGDWGAVFSLHGKQTLFRIEVRCPRERYSPKRVFESSSPIRNLTVFGPERPRETREGAGSEHGQNPISTKPKHGQSKIRRRLRHVRSSRQNGSGRAKRLAMGHWSFCAALCIFAISSQLR